MHSNETQKGQCFSRTEASAGTTEVIEELAMDQKAVRELFSYDQASGDMVWRSRPASHFASEVRCRQWNRSHAGKVAGCTSKTGSGGYKPYIGISAFGKNYRAHRLIWLYVTGSFPKQGIDHIDGDGTNNRLSNLREADALLNNKNLALFKNNTSGICGVSFHSRNRVWRSSISSDGVRRNLGTFKTLLDAACARRSAELKLGFSPSHGAAVATYYSLLHP